MLTNILRHFITIKEMKINLKEWYNGRVTNLGNLVLFHKSGICISLLSLKMKVCHISPVSIALDCMLSGLVQSVVLAIGDSVVDTACEFAAVYEFIMFENHWHVC